MGGGGTGKQTEFFFFSAVFAAAISLFFAGTEIGKKLPFSLFFGWVQAFIFFIHFFFFVECVGDCVFKTFKVLEWEVVISFLE